MEIMKPKVPEHTFQEGVRLGIEGVRSQFRDGASERLFDFTAEWKQILLYHFAEALGMFYLKNRSMEATSNFQNYGALLLMLLMSSIEQNMDRQIN